MRRSERIAGFVEEIWKWYKANKRALPWRDVEAGGNTARAYQILISEVMLQQTQVDRVRVLFVQFLRAFPTLRSLANASNRDVILVWRGMGYNNRALRLRDAARRIVGELGGVFPDDLQVLRSIKGLGHYTAAAIRNFAFNIPTPCLDTNIRRILHRTFVGPERADGSFRVGDRKLLKLAEEVLKVAVTSDVVRCSLARCSTIDQTSNQQRINEQPPRDAANWHAALMDFGALVQTKKDPKWDECPLTARGLMKATPKNSPKSAVRTPKSEPGRQIAGRFVPNRIVRGRIVEALRYAPSGLTLDALGGRVAADWSAVRHRAWLRGILASLERDALITRRARRFALRE